MSFCAASLHLTLEAMVPAAATGFAVAVSGGADSGALLAAVAAVDGGFRALPVRAVHVDHGLQAARADFRRSCAAQADRWHVPLSILTVAVDTAAGQSLEAAAREARYAALGAFLNPGECLLTAHHCEDQAETVLLQALRGGFKGLAGMPQCRSLGAGWHLRPLLEVRRHELLEFGAALDIAGVPDPMNADPRFDRAFLRRRVWPSVEEKWPGAAASLSRTARHVAAAQQIMDLSAAADVARLRDGDALVVTGLRALPPLRQINALRHWIAAVAPPPPQSRLREALRQLLEAQRDQSPAVRWGDHALRRYRDRIFVTAAALPRIAGEREWRVAEERRLYLGAGLGRLRLTPRRGGLNLAALPPTLVVRGRRGGERLKVGPRAATHSVQHLSQALGVLPWMRDALPFVFAGEVLVAVGDLWLDARWCAPAGEPGHECAEHGFAGYGFAGYGFAGYGFAGYGFEWEDAPAVV
jgi:tRNA(Ile)-lysidine synthase